MSTEFALDLRLARRKAGLTQCDIAHLLGVHRARIWALEHGRQLPTVQQICTLSVIYGRSFESLFACVLAEASAAVRDRLRTLPALTRPTVVHFNREANLVRLERRLAEQTSS